MNTRRSTPGCCSPSTSEARSTGRRAAFAGRLPSALALPLAAALLVSCAGSRSVPDPTAKHLEYAEKHGFPSTLVSLKHGRRLYVNRCSGCHNLHKPMEIPAAEWPTVVMDMASNAEIKEDQIRDITRYLVAVASAAQDSTAPRPMGSRDSSDPEAPGADAPGSKAP